MDLPPTPPVFKGNKDPQYPSTNDSNVVTNKIVHFSSPLKPRNGSCKKVSVVDTDLVSDSFSQLDIDDETNQQPMEGTSENTSLTAALNDLPQDPPGTNPIDTHSNVELPFLAESMWKMARSGCRAGTKARTYAQHLTDLSASDTEPIITPWAMGTAAIPPYIVEDKDLMAKIANARRLAARGIQRLVAEELFNRSSDQFETAQAQLERAQVLTQKAGSQNWPKAENHLTTMIAREKALLTKK